ncbi:MAG: 50S ribosomal protein L2, partial [Bacteroidia bacterium]|nr:50S ribosomal protein L2 [Bacteroidia bacterium]
MGIRKFNPITPGTRFKSANTFEELTASSPEKSLTVSLMKSGGRNNTGKMTIRYVGGGHKRKYRLVDFKRTKQGEATVLT